MAHGVSCAKYFFPFQSLIICALYIPVAVNQLKVIVHPLCVSVICIKSLFVHSISLGKGYNSVGTFCEGWAGNCGEGGKGASSWYLMCDRCREK